MFVIFGFTKKPKLIRTLLNTYCYECEKETLWDWLKLTEWISLFFLDVIPFKSQHFLACQNCGYYIELNKQDIVSIQSLKTLSDIESELLHDYVVKKLEDSQLNGKSDTQLKWIKLKKDKYNDENVS